MIYQIILLYLSRHVYILLKLYFIPIPQNNQKYIVFDFFLEKNIWFITYDSKKLLCHIYPILNLYSAQIWFIHVLYYKFLKQKEQKFISTFKRHP